MGRTPLPIRPFYPGLKMSFIVFQISMSSVYRKNPLLENVVPPVVDNLSKKRLKTLRQEGGRLEGEEVGFQATLADLTTKKEAAKQWSADRLRG